MFSPIRAPLPGQKSVTRNKIKEVYYTTHVDNLNSILEVGIQSRNRAIRMNVLDPKHDISDPAVQALREKKAIRSPHDKHVHALHDYVNFYPQPFNAMMAAVRLSRPDLNLCVLRISNTILSIPGTLITNMNAACTDAKMFKPSDWTLTPEEFEAIRSLFFSGSGHQEEELTHAAFKRARQFEVLVLDFVLPRYINGIFVPNEQVKQRIEAITQGTIPVEVNASLFFCDTSYTRQLQLFKPLVNREQDRENIPPTNAFTVMMASKKARTSLTL